MKSITSVREMQDIVLDLRRIGKRIGVVPTMGYLHAGHLSLVEIAKEKTDFVIMTIFVNPTQFGPTEDFTKYPRNIDRDTTLAETAGTDYLFAPSTEEMYPKEYSTYIQVDSLTSVLEGNSRPTHFRGVTTIVAKLFNITQPHVAVFGQKDAQQAIVIRKMVKDLNFPIEIVVAPIVRENDGLAMSSRNVYLSPEERIDSLVLSRSLRRAEELIGQGEKYPSVIINEMKAIINTASSAAIDYIAVSNPATLQDITSLQPNDEVLISMAVKIGKTRLIDNKFIIIP